MWVDDRKALSGMGGRGGSGGGARIVNPEGRGPNGERRMRSIQ